MKKKILVVDDNRTMLTFVSNLLGRKGHQVITAEDGFSALEILTSFVPDIMFIDIIMPNISGDKLCRIIRKMAHLNNCFIVILSGAVAELELDYTEIGANFCIAKGPFNSMTEHILTAVKESDSPRKSADPQPVMGLHGKTVRQMTKELLSRNRHLETILASITEGILEVFSEKIVYANSVAASMLHMSQEKILSSYPPDLFDRAIAPRVETMLKLENGQLSEIGHNTPVELNGRQVTIKNLPVKGEVSTSIIIISDITERKNLELQLQHAQKMEAVGTIASGVAHNFRNTLAGISANSQIVQMNYKGDPQLDKIIERINTSVEKSAQLVEDLMQFSRKQFEISFQEINLAEEMQEIYRIVKNSFNNTIEIRIHVPESLPVIGDASGLNQVLMNLCTNARDAMPQGGNLRLEARQEGKKAIVTISDNGLGMDKETMEQCFNPFFTTKEIGKGTGLGLSTSYGIINNHDGEIHVTSHPDKGSVFTIYLPLAR